MSKTKVTLISQSFLSEHVQCLRKFENSITTVQYFSIEKLIKELTWKTSFSGSCDLLDLLCETWGSIRL